MSLAGGTRTEFAMEGGLAVLAIVLVVLRSGQSDAPAPEAVSKPPTGISLVISYPTRRARGLVTEIDLAN